MTRLTNTFSWSLSRQRLFDECRRKYYLHYYRSWSGWEDDADPAARLAYRLKQIVTLEMWIGDLLHSLIEGHLSRLRRGFRPRSQPLHEQARSLLNQQWRQSLEQRWRENPKHNRNLFAHYYGIEISDQRRGQLRDRLFTCLDHFCESPLLDRLVAAEPDAWLAVEELDTFLVDRTPVYVKIDCAVRLDERTLLIDWKSGKRSPRDADQATCYALYAMQKWNVGFENLRALPIYLLTDETSEQTITAEQALAMQERIVSSMHVMREVLADPAANVAREEDFPMTDEMRCCQQCNFHEICHGPGPIAPAEP